MVIDRLTPYHKPVDRVLCLLVHLADDGLAGHRTGDHLTVFLIDHGLNIALRIGEKVIA